jgi:hypothetical protein
LKNRNNKRLIIEQKYFSLFLKNSLSRGVPCIYFILSSTGIQMMIATLLALLDAVSAQPNLGRYSMTLTDPQLLTATVAVDIGDRKQQTEGRASVVLLPGYTGSAQILKSYPLFNGTFLLSYPNAATSCVYTQGVTLESLFDWSSSTGWLAQATVKQMPNGDSLYAYFFNETMLLVPTLSGQSSQYQFATVTALIAQGGDHPYSVNVSINSYNYAQWLVSNFSTKVTPLHSADWAPPEDSCLVSKLRCPTGSVETLDVYRSHDNRHVVCGRRSHTDLVHHQHVRARARERQHGHSCGRVLFRVQIVTWSVYHAFPGARVIARRWRDAVCVCVRARRCA